MIETDKTLRLLLVEDSGFDRILLQSALDESGINASVTHMRRLNEALATPGLGKLYDVMLLDLNLPDANWSQTLTRLDSEIDAVPVVVMTGMDDEAIGLQAIRAGAQDYLVKGQVDSTLLKRTLRYAVERFRLIADLRVAREHEWQLANLDALTGLPNRRLFEERLDQALHEAKRNGNRVAVMLADLDRFKPINDSLGHATGDEVLATVAQRLRECVRGEDTVARLGGDEFILLLRNLQHPEDAAVVANKIVTHLTETIEVSGHKTGVGVSIGIALSPADSERAEQLIRYADLAMYKAKSAGGNLCSFYSEELEKSAVARMTMESDLRRAISENALLLHYQPIVALHDKCVTGQEVLVRWESPRDGMLSPASFIPLSEQSDLIFSVDDWVLHSACDAAAVWLDKQVSKQALSVNVNLSRRHFRQPAQLVSRVMDSLERSGIKANQLVLEITETAFMDPSSEAVNALSQLRETGIRIAIDDFGVGYSSLHTLRYLPVDILKIDRSFLANVPNEPKSAALTAAIIELGNTLNLEVVAEGVETKEQLAWLRKQGCKYAQGYSLARPSARPVFKLASLA